MIFLESGLYLRVEEMENGPKPLPLNSGFSTFRAYRALGVYSPAETSEAYFVLSNDRNEVWFICNRHFRTYALMPTEDRFFITIKDSQVKAAANKNAQAFFAPQKPGHGSVDKQTTIHKEAIHGKNQSQ
ncbi:MAG: hypothetical protein K2X06_02110 [Burkholderiales bacterium]|nr:hypothetical protein [Burkholderiales bacterium]